MSGRTQTAPLPDHTTAVSEYGQPGDPVLVLIHSALLDRAMWASVATRVTGHRVVTYDLRGHGTAASAPGITGIGQLAADLAALAQALGVTRAHICGVSLGGVIAQQFAADYPDRVASLALVATAARFPRRVLLDRARLLTADRDRALHGTMTRWFGQGNLASMPGAVRYAKGCLGQVTSGTWEQVWKAMAGWDGQDNTARPQVPVLAVAGQNDTSTPPAIVREMAAGFPSARYAEIPGAPHLIPLTHSTALAALLNDELMGYR
jgi:3-oxoadipate enol-lactonase